jgi:hypothetical protein
MKHPPPLLHPNQYTAAIIFAVKGDHGVKKVIWMICGFSAASLGFLAWNSRRTLPVERLAHRLEKAWADHHTVVETV